MMRGVRSVSREQLSIVMSKAGRRAQAQAPDDIYPARVLQHNNLARRHWVLSQVQITHTNLCQGALNPFGRYPASQGNTEGQITPTILRTCRLLGRYLLFKNNYVMRQPLSAPIPNLSSV